MNQSEVLSPETDYTYSLDVSAKVRVELFLRNGFVFCSTLPFLFCVFFLALISIMADDKTCQVAEIRANSVYGALYGLETFVQLVPRATGTLQHTSIHIKDAPKFSWRGLMLDSGRRFVPLATVQNLLDTMAANKVKPRYCLLTI